MIEPTDRPVQQASDYDEMVDWDKRLAREAPFFRELFASAGAHRVLDVGCGTGKHAIMFAQWGLEVVGVDPSEAMLEQARVNADAAGVAVTAANPSDVSSRPSTAGSSITLVSGGFGDLAGLTDEVESSFDAVLTLGNGLPHVEGADGLRATAIDFAAVLRPGGVVVCHLLNHDRLRDLKPPMMPAVFRATSEGPRIYAKVLDYSEEGIDFDFVTVTRDAEGQWHAEDRRSLHTWVTTDLLSDALADAGFEQIEIFGDHARAAFRPHLDESVIVIARRGVGRVSS